MINQAKALLIELLLTFSNKKSRISSKRIERCIAFTLLCTLTCFFIYHNRNTLTATDFLIITGPLGIYAGWNTWNLLKDKKIENEKDSSAVNPGNPSV